MFTEKERAYLSSQRLARLATVSPTGQPDADVIGFELDGEDILIGSYQNLAGSRKYKNVTAGSDRVSLIVDSLASVDPMVPVGVKIHGTAAIEHRNGRFGTMEYIVVRPRMSWSWGVEGPAFVDREFQPPKQTWA